MSRTVLKYVYLALGTVLAAVFTLADAAEVQRKADPDNDGDNERSEAAIRRKQERQIKRGGEARSPMEAATYRANELVQRPLRTAWLLVGYQLLFTGAAVCAVFTDEIVDLIGEDVGFVVELIGYAVTYPVPESLVGLLLPAGVVLGLLFAVVIHPALKTAGDIRRTTVT
jgi:hypothetical protein